MVRPNCPKYWCSRSASCTAREQEQQRHIAIMRSLWACSSNEALPSSRSSIQPRQKQAAAAAAVPSAAGRHLCADVQREPHSVHQVGLHHTDVLRASRSATRQAGEAAFRSAPLHLHACRPVATPSAQSAASAAAKHPVAAPTAAPFSVHSLLPAARPAHVQVGAGDGAAAGRLGGPVLLLQLALLLLQPEDRQTTRAGSSSEGAAGGGRKLL